MVMLHKNLKIIIERLLYFHCKVFPYEPAKKELNAAQCELWKKSKIRYQSMGQLSYSCLDSFFPTSVAYSLRFHTNSLWHFAVTEYRHCICECAVGPRPGAWVFILFVHTEILNVSSPNDFFIKTKPQRQSPRSCLKKSTKVHVVEIGCLFNHSIEIETS